MYLEYEVSTKQVVQIHVAEPITVEGYDYAVSSDFAPGDEFEQTIWINDVDENKNVTSYSAIRNNPNAQRLLRENQQLKQANEELRAANELLTENLIDFKYQYTSVPCQLHQEYPAIVDGIIEGAKNDGTTV